MNFVFVTDPHVTHAQPVSRKDNYFETIINKLRWVVNLANAHDAHIIFGGDIVDAYNVSPAVITAIAKILRAANKQCYGIIGNHDIYGHTWSVMDQVMVGPLFASRLITLLTEEPIILTEGDIKVQLTGANYIPDIDEHKELYQVRKQKDVDYAVHVVHGFLVNKNWPSFDHSQYTTIHEVITEADVICSGHEHHGYGIEKVGETLFTNPGALGRVHASEGEMARMPQVTAIVCTKEEVRLQLVDVACAKPGEEVMSRAHIVAEKAKQASLNTFIQGLQAEMMICDINAVFERQARALNIEPAVREKAIEAYGAYDARQAERVNVEAETTTT